jgi:TDG/mug DNA glycosylase family protein
MQRPASPYRPSPADLAAAHGTTIPDVLAPDLRVLFCGINPGLWSGATGHHFARPGNRFWPALHRSGFTPRQYRPDEQDELLALGLGITNVAPRATARADELTPEELRAGGAALTERVARYRPRVLAVLGLGAYRTAFGRPRTAVGPQPDRLGATEVWVLPNPSGLNAHYSLDALAAEFRTLREAVEAVEPAEATEAPAR